MKDSKGRLRCNRCGAFVTPDHESRYGRYHYTCVNCMSTGYIVYDIVWDAAVRGLSKEADNESSNPDVPVVGTAKPDRVP